MYKFSNRKDYQEKMENVLLNCLDMDLSSRKHFFSAKALAKVLGVSTSTIYRWIKTNKLPSWIRISREEREDRKGRYHWYLNIDRAEIRYIAVKAGFEWMMVNRLAA